MRIVIVFQPFEKKITAHFWAGGEGGIRTHGPSIHRDNRLAGDPDRPLQHLSA